MFTTFFIIQEDEEDAHIKFILHIRNIILWESVKNEHFNVTQSKFDSKHYAMLFFLKNKTNPPKIITKINSSLVIGKIIYK